MANLSTSGGDKNSRILLDQINARTRQRAVKNGKFPADLKSGDGTTRISGDTLHLGQSDGKQVREFPISRALTQFTGLTSSDTLPTTDDLPTDGDWGWHTDTVTGFTYFARNIADVIVYPTSAFTSITGSITAAQHGAQTVGTLHAAVTSSVNGFMLATDKVILDAGTSVATASVLVKRNATAEVLASAIVESDVAKTASYTLTYSDCVVFIAPASISTFTLPTAVGHGGRSFRIKRTNASAFGATVACTGGQTIDGAATYAMNTQYDLLIVVSDGADWFQL